MVYELPIKVPVDKLYAVLKLPIHEEFKIYAVPACTSWLEQVYITYDEFIQKKKYTAYAGICKWPPDEKKLSDYLEKRKRPDDTWIRYQNVKILKFCKSLREAKERIEKALEVSDLSETVSDGNVKRRRVATQRYSPPLRTMLSNTKLQKNNDADADNTDTDAELKRPTVTHFEINRRRNAGFYTAPLVSDDSDINEGKMNDIHINSHTFQTSVDIHKNADDTVKCRPTFTKENEKTRNIQENTRANYRNIVMRGKEDSLNLNSRAHLQFTTSQESSSPILLDKSHFQINDIAARTIMAAINDLRNRIDMVHVTVRKMYTSTCPSEEVPETLSGIPSLPLASMEEFNNWDTFLSDESNKSMMVRMLAEHGKEDIKSSVYAIMRKLMTNEVAVNFNLKGINRQGAAIIKKKFLNSSFYHVIIGALKRHKKDRNGRSCEFVYSREGVDTNIARWLKDARKRLHIEQEKRNIRHDELSENTSIDE